MRLAGGRGEQRPALALLAVLGGKHDVEALGDVEPVQRPGVLAVAGVDVGADEGDPDRLGVVGLAARLGVEVAQLADVVGRIVAAGQVGSEQASGDLRRRPPERARAGRCPDRCCRRRAPPSAGSEGLRASSGRPAGSAGRRGARRRRRCPISAAIPAAATSACSAARPPCLSGNQVASPTAQTRSTPGTRIALSVGMNPCAFCGRPGDLGNVELGDRDPVGGLGAGRPPSAGTTPVLANSTPCISSRSATCAEAAAPKHWSGVCSGVWKATRAAVLLSRCAACSASS